MPCPRPFALAALVALLTGCASLGGEDPPVCDGRHRRPANPLDSTLVVAPAPTPAAPQAAPAAPPDGGCA